jgi:hypothetical protein
MMNFTRENDSSLQVVAVSENKIGTILYIVVTAPPTSQVYPLCPRTWPEFKHPPAEASSAGALPAYPQLVSEQDRGCE